MTRLSGKGMSVSDPMIKDLKGTVVHVSMYMEMSSYWGLPSYVQLVGTCSCYSTCSLSEISDALSKLNSIETNSSLLDLLIMI